MSLRPIAQARQIVPALVAVAVLLASLLSGGGPAGTALAQVPTSAGAVIASIPLRTFAGAVAVNPVTNRIFVLDGGCSDTLLNVFDGATFAKIASLPVACGTRDVAVNPVTNRVYLATNNQHLLDSPKGLTVLDGTSLATVAFVHIPYPYAQNWSRMTSIAIDPDRNRIYVTDPEYDRVHRVDGAAHTRTGTHVFRDTNNAIQQVTVLPAIDRVFVSDSFYSHLLVLPGDWTDNNTPNGPNPEIGRVSTHSCPVSVGADVVTNRVFSANKCNVSASFVDGALMTHLSGPAFPNDDPSGIDANPVTHRTYVALWSSNRVAVLDGASATPWTSIVGHIATSPGPRELAVDSVRNRVYVSATGKNGANGALDVIDATEILPSPTATHTPSPTATNTPSPTATNTPVPTVTNTPQPTTTSIPEPTATFTTIPTSIPAATATSTPARGRSDPPGPDGNGPPGRERNTPPGPDGNGPPGRGG